MLARKHPPPFGNVSACVVGHVLALALTGGPWLLLPLKLSHTGVGVCVLEPSHQVPLAQRGWQGLALSDGGVLLMHLAIVLRLA